MKTMMMTLTAAMMMTIVSQQAFACRITRAGDSARRVDALHKTLEQGEELQGFDSADGVYELRVITAKNTVEARVYRLVNMSRMCPDYRAHRVE